MVWEEENVVFPDSLWQSCWNDGRAIDLGGDVIVQVQGKGAQCGAHRVKGRMIDETTRAEQSGFASCSDDESIAERVCAVKLRNEAKRLKLRLS